MPRASAFSEGDKSCGKNSKAMTSSTTPVQSRAAKCKLRRSNPSAASSSKRRSKRGQYTAMETSSGSSPNLQEDAEAGFASDSSSDSKQRLSPPTQIQSLSEETSSTDGGRSSKILSPSNFGSDEDDDSSDSDLVVQQKDGGGGGSEPATMSRKRILAGIGVGGAIGSSTQHPSRTHLIDSSSSSASSLSDREDDGGAKNAAESMDYVKQYGEVPKLLAKQKEEAEEEEKKGGNNKQGLVAEEEDSFSILTDAAGV